MFRSRSSAVVLLLLATAAVACQPPEAPEQAEQPAPSDELLLAAAKIALPPTGVAAADLPDAESDGAVVLMSYCAQCHALPAPTSHSATDWPGVLRRMWLRMDQLPTELEVRLPDPIERYALVDYLTENALQVGDATLPEARGREAFERVCSQCHALPDPRTHSAADWPAVFLRMEQNMERMQVTPPSSSEAGDVLTYLQAVGGSN